MYTVSKEYREAVNNPGGRDWKLDVRIRTEAGKTYTVDKFGVLEKGLKIDYGVMSGKDFAPGGVCAANIALTILDEGQYEGVQFNYATVTPRVGLRLPDGRVEWVPLGVYTIDSVEHRVKTPGVPFNAIALQGMDNMARLDRPFAEVGIAFPCTAVNLLTAVCQHCGVPLMTTQFYNCHYAIRERPAGDMSCRDIVSSIAELAVSWAKCSREGGLELDWFHIPEYIPEAELDGGAFSPWITGGAADGGAFVPWDMGEAYCGGPFADPEDANVLTAANRYDFNIDDAPIRVTGIAVDTEEGSYSVGTDGYVVYLDNPLIQADIDGTLNGMLDQIENFTFMPFRSARRDDPAIEAGDYVIHENVSGNDYPTIITKYSYAYGSKCQLESVGSSQASVGFRSPSQKKYSQLLRRIGQKQEQLNALDQAIAVGTQVLANAMGGKWIDGDDIGYPGEKFVVAAGNDVHADVKVWRYNHEGWGFYPHGINGKASMGATADNSMWANLITANMIRTGLLESLHGESWINMDDGSFSFGDGTLTYLKPSSGEFPSLKIAGELSTGYTGTFYSILRSYCKIYDTEILDNGTELGFYQTYSGNKTGAIRKYIHESAMHDDDNYYSKLEIESNNGFAFIVNGREIGASGTFKSADNKIVTVDSGIVTKIQ